MGIEIVKSLSALQKDSNKTEFILSAAIWYKSDKLTSDEFYKEAKPVNIKEGIVITGWRHHNCILLAASIWGSEINEQSERPIQGFLTSKNRFVNRKEAGEIAFKAGQTDSQYEMLISECLY